MNQDTKNEVRIEIPKLNRNEFNVFEEKSDVPILLIILVILSIPIVMGRVRNFSFPINVKSSKNSTINSESDLKKPEENRNEDTFIIEKQYKKTPSKSF